MLPKCFQNGPKWGPEGFCNLVWDPERFRGSTQQQNFVHLGPKIESKIDPEAFQNILRVRANNDLLFA